MQYAFPDLPIFRIKEIGLEFIPTPIEQYTNDKSAMDTFISFWDKDGGEHIIAIETKYTNSLVTNKAKDNTLKSNCSVDYLEWLNWFEDRYLNFGKLDEKYFIH